MKASKKPWFQSKLAPLYVVDRNYSVVCSMGEYKEDGSVDGMFENADANMLLIAAAPELLEALKGILEIGKRDTTNPKYDGYYDTARAAVAKAEKAI